MLFGLVGHITSDHVQKPDPYGDWVLLGGLQTRGEDSVPVGDELLSAAREAWPHVLAHARRELADKGLGADKTALAAEAGTYRLRTVIQEGVKDEINAHSEKIEIR